MTRSSPEKDREDRLDEVVAAYLEAIERGERPDRREWLARYPDLAAELAEFIDDQNRVQGWTSPIRAVPRPPASGSSAGGSPLAAGDPLATLHVTSRALADLQWRIPNYELLDEIARGGMGIVYRARQLNPNRIVALKMILAGPRATDAELYRFRMETEAAASLDHPHIMPIYEVGSQSGRPFFSMKLMEGGTLAGHLPRFAGDGRAAAELLIKVARAVHHAHLRGILHRDLKPANILLDAQGEPFVTDFGLCRRVEVDSGMTQSGVIVGTPSYMSPEQAAGRKGLTTATDVYSLGAVLYALLTDRPPFRGDTPLETVRGVLEDEPSRPRLLRPQVDRDLETICLKCLEKQPGRRYRSAESVADDLERWLAGEPIVARRTSVWERTWKRARRNPAGAALVAVSSLALVLLIAAGLIYQNHRLAVAEQALANHKRIERLSSEANEHLARAARSLLGGDARNAQLHAKLAIEQSQADPELQAVARQARELLDQAHQQLAAEQARIQARESFDRFQASRNRVLYFDSHSQLPVIDSSRAVEQLFQAGAAALAEIGLSPDGQGEPRPGSDLPATLQRTLKEQSYELLLILAEVSARQSLPDLDRALRLSTRAIEFGSPTHTYHAHQASYFARLGKPEAAAREGLLAAALSPTTALDCFLRGRDAWRQGDVLLATSELRKAVALQPGHVWARFCLAACLLPTSPRESEVHLSIILRDAPDLEVAYLLRGNAYTLLGQLEDAEADFAKALKRTELSYTALVNRGDLYTRHRLFDRAETDLRKAIALQPNAHSAHLVLARTCELQLRAQESAEHLTLSLAAKDLTPPVQAAILLYRAANHTRDRDLARADLYRSLDTHPYAEAFVQLAEERLRQKALTGEDCHAVIEWCDYALASPAYSPDTYAVSRTHYLRALALVELRNYETAALALDQFVEAGGKPDGEVQRLRGMIRAEQRDFPKAIGLLSDSLALDPHNPSTLAERGSVYLAMGALDLAVDDFRAALAADPAHANALAGRGMIRALRGNYEGAEDDAERAWALGPQTERYAWMAARTLAIVHGRLQSRGTFVSVEESKNMVRYRQRAIAMLEQALLRAAPDKRPSLWHEAIETDVWFPLLSDEPAFRELKRKYAPSTRSAPPL